MVKKRMGISWAIGNHIIGNIMGMGYFIADMIEISMGYEWVMGYEYGILWDVMELA